MNEYCSTCDRRAAQDRTACRSDSTNILLTSRETKYNTALLGQPKDQPLTTDALVAQNVEGRLRAVPDGGALDDAIPVGLDDGGPDELGDDFRQHLFLVRLILGTSVCDMAGIRQRKSKGKPTDR